MAAGISYIGAYSPLIMKRYSDYLGALGNTDNSLGYRYTDPETFQRDFYKLSLANVKYVYAAKPISHPSLELFTQTDSSNYVYVNSEVLARAYFMPYAASGVHQWGMVTVQKYENQSVSLYVHANVPGKVVLNDIYYPGWKAYINGKEVEIVRSNDIFRAVAVPAGKHTVRFEYKPSGLKKGAAVSFLTLLLILLLLGFDLFIKPRQAK